MEQIEEFKAAAGKYPTGVTIISTEYNGQLYGFTANSFTSVSLEPKLISFCLNIKAGSFNAFLNSKHFVINILANNQHAIASRFASSISDKFENIDYDESQFGIPLIKGALSFLECQKYDQIQAGDHYIFIGEVTKSTIDNSDNSPLIYFGRSYRELK